MQQLISHNSTSREAIPRANGKSFVSLAIGKGVGKGSEPVQFGISAREIKEVFVALQRKKDG